jgi:uncharacterized protein YbjQ (UPF0145 family)
MITTSIENIPGKKYKVVGFVYGTTHILILSDKDIFKLTLKIIDQAKAIKADAVVGIRVFTTSNNGAGMYGTAVKFIE